MSIEYLSLLLPLHHQRYSLYQAVPDSIMTTDLGHSRGGNACSDRFRTAEQTTVDSVNNWLSTDLPTTEESSIEPFDGVLSTLDPVEFEVDIALRVRI